MSRRRTIPDKFRSEYRSYCGARNRCTSRNNSSWAYYGGRGIEFRFKSFNEFLDALGPRPKGRMLDRENNDGHYEPGNVRWVTRHVSLLNRRFLKESTNPYYHTVVIILDAETFAKLSAAAKADTRKPGQMAREIIRQHFKRLAATQVSKAS